MLLKKNKVDVIWGEGTIAKAGEVTVKPATKSVEGPPAPAPKGALGPGSYKGQSTSFVATGARPRVLPGIEPDKTLIWTLFRGRWSRKRCRSRSSSWARAPSAWNSPRSNRTMGAEVTVVEVMPQILPVEDAEIATMARKRFEKQGIKILTSAKVTKVEKGASSVTATIETDKGSQQITADKLISAVGVVGNVEGLGLEALGVKLERGLVATDGLGRTNVPGIYAIGDVAGPPMLAHKAEHEGVICVETIAGKAHPPDGQGHDPRLHLLPPADRVGGPHRGQGEGAGDRGQGRPLPLRRQRQGDRARRARRHGQGPSFDAKTGKLIGAHMIGAEVTELIQGYVVAMNLENHRGRADAHGLPAPHAVGDDARERAGCVWAGDSLLMVRDAGPAARWYRSGLARSGRGWRPFFRHVRAAAPQLGALYVCAGNGVWETSTRHCSWIRTSARWCCGGAGLEESRPSRATSVALLEACGLARHGARVVLRNRPRRRPRTSDCSPGTASAVSPPLAHGEDWLVYPYVGGTPPWIGSSRAGRPVCRRRRRTPCARSRYSWSARTRPGIVLGDRWGGNEIIGPEGDVVLIDFDVGLVGAPRRPAPVRPGRGDRRGARGPHAVPDAYPGRKRSRRSCPPSLPDRQDASRVAAMLDGHRRYYRSGRHQATGLAKPSAWYAAFDPILAQAAGHD